MPSARELIDYHADLSERWRKRDTPIVEYIHSFATSVASGGSRKVTLHKGQDRAQLMFYPYHVTTTEGAGEFVGRVGRDLFEAPTYEITAEIMHLLRQAHDAGANPVEIVWDKELPTDSGWVWLDEALDHRDADGAVAKIRAVSWARTTVRVAQRPGSLPGVRLIFWSHIDDKDDYFPKLIDITHTRAQHVSVFGELTLIHAVVVPFGIELGHDLASETAEGEARRQHDSMLAFLHALWMFMQMELTTTRRESPPRQARRRIERMQSLRHTDVNIIILRRAKHLPEDAYEHRHVDWSCRWIVRGHYRHLIAPTDGQHSAQPDGHGMCQVCGVRCAWVAPYIKGPDGKPLRTADQLYKIMR